ncbi:MAG TPA: spore germination protein [Bacillota bacterium]|nr:spore germination protein [Bacillota bacterium]
MFRYIFRKLKLIKALNQLPDICEENQAPNPNAPKALISKNLQENFAQISAIFHDSPDVVIRKFVIGDGRTEALIVNLEGMSEYKLINENIMGSLMREAGKPGTPEEITLEYLKNSAINLNGIKETTVMEEAVEAVLKGNTAFFLDGSNIALIIKSQTWEHRAIQKSETEVNIRGPKEGFTETLSVNISQIRRIIKDPALCIEGIKLGRRTRTEVGVVYIKDIADPKLVAEVWRRLRRIDIDAVLESGYIEELIEDAPLSVFPTVGNTETPDKFAAKVLEGRVGILIEGTPFALTVPFLFVESFQTAEDYYSRSYFSSLLRILRALSLHLTVALPALYVAIVTFHPNVLPEALLRTISITREGIPFPAFVEALLMGIIYEVFHEGIVHMPRTIAPSVSIIGALILGQAVVNAGVISPIMIIIYSLTAIMGFLLPTQTNSVTLLRIPVLIMSSLFGLFGILWSYVFVIIHLVSLRSFGVPYMAPLMPMSVKDLKDSLIRLPWPMLKTRPQIIDWKGSQRLEDGLAPKPPTTKKSGGSE